MSVPDSRKALEDTVFLALQRPAMFMGCPLEGVALNATASLLVGAWLGNGAWRFAWWVGLSLTTHFLLRFGTARDYNWFRTKRLWIETQGHGTEVWGGSTVAPLPSRLPRSAKDLPLAY